jgi:hypothetical protein
MFSVRRRASAKTGKNGRPKEVGKGIGDFRMQVIKATRLNRRKNSRPVVFPGCATSPVRERHFCGHGFGYFCQDKSN